MASTAAVKSLCVASSSISKATSHATGAPSAILPAPFFGRALTGSKACSSAFSGRQLGLSRFTTNGRQCVMVAEAPSKDTEEAKPPSYYMNFEPPADIDEFTRDFMNSTLEDEDPEYDTMWKKFFFDEDEEVVEAVDDEEDGIKRLRPPERRKKDQYQENVVQVSRVNKTVKGGNQLSFRAVVVIGDGKGAVGVGVGKAKEVMNAVLKAGVDARRHIIKVPLNKQKSIPHRMEGRYGAAKVLLRPAPLGTGVIAGGSVRTVLEMAGVENTFGKQLGSNNPLNNARATLVAIGNMFDRKEVAEFRKVPIESLRV